MKREIRAGSGFTLIEVMIVVAIISILAAISFPSYQRYIERGNRVEARNLLQSAAQQLEANFTVNRSYNCLVNESPCTQPINNGTLATWGLNRSDHYTISFDGDPGARTYTLQAVPNESQENDGCGIFRIDQRNVKTVEKDGVKSGSRDPKSIQCWNK